MLGLNTPASAPVSSMNRPTMSWSILPTGGGLAGGTIILIETGVGKALLVVSILEPKISLASLLEQMLSLTSVIEPKVSAGSVVEQRVSLTSEVEPEISLSTDMAP